jgi:hypothetical protein
MITAQLSKFERPCVQLDEDVRTTSRKLLHISPTVVEPSIATPTEIMIGSLRDGRLRVMQPIRVKFSKDGAGFIAEAIDLNEFGFGGNQSEAVADLQHAIAELYFSLRDERNRLGPDLRRVWKKVDRAIIEPAIS